jgi:(E)-2-((N-methylformamido)methylene)succinate hydrolase
VTLTMSENARPTRAAPLLSPRLILGGTAYRDEGDGEAIVLVHGVGLNADAWSPQIAALSRTYRVIALDMSGHGASARPGKDATLTSYVTQVDELLQALGIASANIIGHSMGGLVALGFALTYPKKTLRLGVLNTVYKRTPEQRAAVLNRARAVSTNGAMGNLDEPLTRWFGAQSKSTEIAKCVHAWLLAADPVGYATAYEIFAKSDDVFAGRLHALAMPALFATGSLDSNSSPEMAAAMARETPHGSCVVVKDERHMMNLTSPIEVSNILHTLLVRPPKAIDLRDLRTAFGTFMTGVTVVTTREDNGSLRGFTANSFSSVSLDPPLLLICLSKTAASFDVFLNARHFAVNILAESQKDLSSTFASKRPDKFTGVDWNESESGSPLISGAAAWFDCINHQSVDAGDHVILIGRVTSYGHTDASPLGYGRGGYFTLGLEQSAVNALSQSSRAEVGAILECDGRLVVEKNAATSRYALPCVGEAGKAGSASQLVSFLEAAGVRTQLGFLFAVFENSESHTQSIYYRGTAVLPPDSKFETIPFDALPWNAFQDAAVVSMLRRYCDERVQGRYRIYSGDHVRGEIKELND